MELLDNLTTFWSVIVSPERPCTIKIPNGVSCGFSTASIGRNENTPDNGRTVLMAKVNGHVETSIVPFIHGKFESTSLQIEFGELDSIEFRIVGVQVPVHLCGFLSGGFSIEIEGAGESTLPDIHVNV